MMVVCLAFTHETLSPRLVNGTNGLHQQDTMYLGWWEVHLTCFYEMPAKPSVPSMHTICTYPHVPCENVIPDKSP